MEPFSHVIFWENPLPTLCFFSFGMCFISLWIRKSVWLWGSFLLLAFIFAFQSHIASWLSLIPVFILLFCHFFLNKPISKSTRYILFGIAVLVSFALAAQFLPDFKDWKVASSLNLGPNSHPYNLWLKFDKPFIGLFVLIFALPLISSPSQLYDVFKVAIPMSVIGILIMISLSWSLGIVGWAPKIPIISFVWMVNQILFVCIPEEAFFRGFIQREIYNWWGKSSSAAFGSIVITSLIFSLFHLFWIAELPFLFLVFIASVIYGTIYQTTQAIESSILCHFAMNTTHFFLFTYPTLQP